VGRRGQPPSCSECLGRCRGLRALLWEAEDVLVVPSRFDSCECGCKGRNESGMRGKSEVSASPRPLAEEGSNAWHSSHTTTISHHTTPTTTQTQAEIRASLPAHDAARDPPGRAGHARRCDCACLSRLLLLFLLLGRNDLRRGPRHYFFERR